MSSEAQGGRRRCIDSREFRQRMALSQSTFDRLKAARKLPRHLELTNSTHRWDEDEVEQWIAAGCPDQAAWEAQKKAARR